MDYKTRTAHGPFVIAHRIAFQVDLDEIRCAQLIVENVGRINEKGVVVAKYATGDLIENRNWNRFFTN